MADAVTWLRYEAATYEARSRSGFPMTTAPWPLLMPLYHAYPLAEAQYILETNQGRHGRDRYHTYGPYQAGEAEWAAELHPSPWHWNAWPDVIIHGGVCTVMAPMAVETHVSLGDPAMMAGQPGHCNFFSFGHAGNSWHTAVEHDFSGGPTVTFGAWLFNEIGNTPGLGEQNGRPWAGAEYQLGLSLAMNVGLSRYIDTRIAVNLYEQLSKEAQPVTGAALLKQAIRTNPYNPGPWYLLAQQTRSPVEGIELAQLATVTQRTLSVNSLPSHTTNCFNGYWEVMKRRLVKIAILRHPVPPEPATATLVYKFLLTCHGITETQKAAYASKANPF